MKHLLKLSDLTQDELLGLLDLAAELKAARKRGEERSLLAGKTLGMIFRKSSTRTRVSFEVGMTQLGGHALFLSSNDIQLGRGEPIEDTARVLSRYVDGVMIRTFAQAEVETLAQYSAVPVINGLTDFAHPCQILADLLTVRERYGTLAGLTVAYIGDGNNVCNSLIAGAALCGMRVRVATPPGYEPDKGICERTGDRLLLTNDPREAVRGADAVFTDVWASMGQEAEVERRKRDFAGFCVDAALMALANPGAMVQHCLPAHRGEEITADVFEAHANEIFDEAENRLHVQKAVIVRLMAG